MLDRAHDEREVGLANQRELLVAFRARRQFRRRPPAEFGQALLAQEMQIDGVEHAQRVGRDRAHGVDMLDRDVVPRHHDDVELVAACIQESGDRIDVRRKQDFDTAALKVRYVRLTVFKVVGDERDLAFERGQDLEDGEHPQRAGVLVRRQHASVDDQHAALRPAIARKPRLHAVGMVRGERLAPLGRERLAMRDLVLLGAGRFVRPRRLPLEMHDGRQRLVEHLATRGAHGEGKIGVFVVCRRVT